MGVPKVMIFFAILVGSMLYWATSNVCKYNFALEKRTNILNVVTEEIDPTLGNATSIEIDIAIFRFDAWPGAAIDLERNLIEDIQTDYNFTPKTKLSEGIPKFIEWFKSYHNLN